MSANIELFCGFKGTLNEEQTECVCEEGSGWTQKREWNYYIFDDPETELEKYPCNSNPALIGVLYLYPFIVCTGNLVLLSLTIEKKKEFIRLLPTISGILAFEIFAILNVANEKIELGFQIVPSFLLAMFLFSMGFIGKSYMSRYFSYLSSTKAVKDQKVIAKIKLFEKICYIFPTLGALSAFIFILMPFVDQLHRQLIKTLFWLGFSAAVLLIICYNYVVKLVADDIQFLIRSNEGVSVISMSTDHESKTKKALKAIRKKQRTFTSYMVLFMVTCIFGFFDFGLQLWKYYFPVFGFLFSVSVWRLLSPRLRKAQKRARVEELRYLSSIPGEVALESPAQLSPVKRIRGSGFQTGFRVT